MARLTKEQWAEARTQWEGNPALSFGALAESLGVSRPAVSKRASEEGWTKGAAPSAGPVTPPAKVTPKVTKVTPKVSSAEPPAGESESPPQPLPEMPRLSSEDWERMTRRPVGRPPVYRDEFVDEIVRYFDIPVESVVDVDVVGKDGKTTTEKKVVLNTFPTLTRFASSIGVTRETLHDWATAKNPDGTLKRPEFSYAHARAKDLQDALLVEGGLTGRYDGRFAVFAAKNLIGWKDQIETKSEVTLTTATTEQLDDAYKRGIELAAANRAKVLARRKEQAITVEASE